MIPINQIVFEDDVGDCFRCCIASILNLSLEEVPNFLEVENWQSEAKEWLKSRGFRMFEITFPDPQVLERTYFANCGYCILSGVGPRKSKNGKVKYHAVVGMADGYGIKIIHDPHPSKEGLLDWGYRWVKFIVKE